MEFDTIVILLRTVFWLAGALYVVAGAFWPLWFGTHVSFQAWSEERRRGLDSDPPSLWRFIVIPTLAIGVGVFVYFAVYPLTDVIPYDWGTHDEDGDWTSTRDHVRLLLTIIGMLSVCNYWEKRGIQAVKTHASD